MISEGDTEYWRNDVEKTTILSVIFHNIRLFFKSIFFQINKKP